jgi:hypothetical protein
VRAASVRLRLHNDLPCRSCRAVARSRPRSLGADQPRARARLSRAARARACKRRRISGAPTVSSAAHASTRAGSAGAGASATPGRWEARLRRTAVSVVAALAVAPGFTGGERPTLEPSPPQRAAAPHREAIPPVAQRPGRNRSKPRTETVATPGKHPNPHRSVVPGRPALEREAEQNVLQSPRLFLEQGGAAAALVDPATKLFRANTTITCAMTQRRRNGSWERMCRVRRGRVSVRIRYVPTGRSSFQLAAPAAGP